jgi:hypothetical protein
MAKGEFLSQYRKQLAPDDFSQIGMVNSSQLFTIFKR